MRFVWIFLAVSGCVGSEIETDSKHPASSDAPTAPRSRAAAALEPGFDPFAGDDAAAPAPDEHQHHHH